jgi:hypothetical protein
VLGLTSNSLDRGGALGLLELLDDGFHWMR